MVKMSNIFLKIAQGDNNIAASITQTFQSEDADVVVAIATPVAPICGITFKNNTNSFCGSQ